MPERRIMLVAGEPSGDALGAELVTALRQAASPGLQLSFMGAGGPRMAAAGVELKVDLASHAVVGLWEALRKYGTFRALFGRLLDHAAREKPDVVVLIDFSGFNRRFAAAVRERSRASRQTWSPKLVYFVSPQVWASRPGRAQTLARDLDLLLSIFPFEKDWYARRAPSLRVEFIGHPIVDRYPNGPLAEESVPPRVVLLPGSRASELARHLPPMLEAVDRVSASAPGIRWHMVLPSAELLAQARALAGDRPGLDMEIGNLAETLRGATAAVASTGTVTMECAWFGVPTVAIYKTSWSTYQIGKRIIQVRFLAMPNLLADGEIFPELIQDDATGARIGAELLSLLGNPGRRAAIRKKLSLIRSRLGDPGAASRAAGQVLQLLDLP